LYLALEYCPGNSLDKLLLHSSSLPEGEVRDYARQIIIALEYLHSKGIIFRDLKPENILLAGQTGIKLTDFGLAVDSNASGKEGFAGSPAYISPEVLREEEPTYKSDIYSLGTVLYEMLAGIPPFYDDNI
jgi:serine/threonine protein kinase